MSRDNLKLSLALLGLAASLAWAYLLPSTEAAAAVLLAALLSILAARR
jgi:hypothetical protein